MKSLKIFIALALIIFLVGFIFSKNIFLNAQKNKATVSSSEIRMNYLNYLDYSPEKLSQAMKRGRVVLFFAAPWCSTCTGLDKELKEKSNQLPDDVTILKVNFDTQKDLKGKYQVIYQHTLVQIDTEGGEIAKWIGGDIETIKQELK